jgi:uncharacterized membrane protein YccC
MRRLRAWWPADPPRRTRPGWLPTWSEQAALRAVRATIVVPGLFALTFKIIGNPQMTLFAVFGSFATLVFAQFGGTRRDKAIAHLGLAVAGSILLVIGTLVSGTTWLAALVTVPVVFAVLFFSSVAGRNAALGVTGALLAYVLPVASAGSAGTIGARLAGWWLASVVGTAAVLLMSPRTAGDRLRASAARLARALAAHVDAAVSGAPTTAQREQSRAAKAELITTFGGSPYRPTGLATTDQGLANIVELLEWCTGLVHDALDGHLDLREAAPADLRLLAASAGLLRDVGGLLSGQAAAPELDELDAARAASAQYQREHAADPVTARTCAGHAVHAQEIAVTVRAVVADALIVAGRAGPDLIAEERRRWYGAPQTERRRRLLPAMVGAAEVAARHASIRSVWFRSSARGAVALATAVAVADLSGVQHGFWVVLGTLSVLRTNAASTGSTAARALAGTVVGFAVGAALLLAIGTSPTALWIILPLAVLVATYAPGTAPFAVGQAAFTVAVVVIFNLLVPAGWRVGLLRIEDVAIGCGVSVVVGLLFWPRGASAVVGDDLADAFRRGASYLRQAVDWSLGVRTVAPDAAEATVTASLRLDEALRGYLGEQGAKRISKDDLWGLVMATTRLRLTAYSLASLETPGGHDGVPADPDRVPPDSDGVPTHPGGVPTHPGGSPAHPGGSPAHPGGSPAHPDGDYPRADAARAELRSLTAELSWFYERVAHQIGRPDHEAPVALTVPPLDGLTGPEGLSCVDTMPADYHIEALWVREHLHHLAVHAQQITAPAVRLAQMRRLPWWREARRR